MTTVAWDGKTLASDSLVTITDTNWDNSPQMCPECDHDLRRTHGVRVKIVDLRKSEIFVNGSRCLALGSSGGLTALKIVKSLLEMCSNIKLSNELRFLDAVKSPLKKYTSEHLLICEDKVIRLGITPSSETITDYPLDSKLSIGTGSSAALAAMKVFGGHAVDAVDLARFVDEYTGGAINCFDVFSPESEIRQVTSDWVDAVAFPMVSGEDTLKETSPKEKPSEPEPHTSEDPKKLFVDLISSETFSSKGLLTLRDNLFLSQIEAAEIIGISKGTYWKLENGTYPSDRLIARISKKKGSSKKSSGIQVSSATPKKGGK